jgi:hypothetical protein
MKEKINQFIDNVSEFLAYRKGLLPIIGILLIILNWILQFIPVAAWVVGTNTLLHIGAILAIIGFMIAWAL